MLFGEIFIFYTVVTKVRLSSIKTSDPQKTLNKKNCNNIAHFAVILSYINVENFAVYLC